MFNTDLMFHLKWNHMNTFVTYKYACSLWKQKRSTEGCSKLKSPETRQAQERLASTLEYMQVPKWDRTRRPEEQTSPVGMPHPLQMPYGNLYSVITS